MLHFPGPSEAAPHSVRTSINHQTFLFSNKANFFEDLAAFFFHTTIMSLVSGPGRAGFSSSLPDELQLAIEPHIKYIQSLDTVRIPLPFSLNPPRLHSTAQRRTRIPPHRTPPPKRRLLGPQRPPPPRKTRWLTTASNNRFCAKLSGPGEWWVWGCAGTRCTFIIYGQRSADFVFGGWAGRSRNEG